MTLKEKLAQKNGIDISKPIISDKDRIKALEEKNADLRVQVAEQANALIELAEMLVEVE